MHLDPVFWALIFGAPVVFWLLPARLRYGFLTAASIGYLATRDWTSVAALLGWSVLFFLVAPKALASGSSRRRVSLGLVLAILGYLVFFKYAPPLWNALAPDDSGMSVVLPLGISFFTFKLIHYAFAVRDRQVTDRSLATFLSYVFLFPAFTAGPIERYDHFLEHREDRLTVAAAAAGLTRIAHGLVKKFVLAEIVVRQWLLNGATAADVVARAHELGVPGTWGFLAASLLYAYFDFAGYSDLAIGGSRLFGLRIMENFNHPLTSAGIGQFWKRWHMTLAGWCQAYVYMPVMARTRNPVVAVYATFVVMGLWHEGNLNYLCWGLYHGTGVVVALSWARTCRRRGWARPSGRVRTALVIAATLLFVTGSSIFSTTSPLGADAMLRLGAAALGLPIGGAE